VYLSFIGITKRTGYESLKIILVLSPSVDYICFFYFDTCGEGEIKYGNPYW
jgi:hypothetical protein